MVGSPDDIEALKAELATERAARLAAEAKVSSIDALIASLKLQIEKMRRELYGQRSERKARLLDQMELELEGLQASATEDELKAEIAAAETTEVKAFTRKKPSRKPFPEHLPRERVVISGPTSCNCCGSEKLAKLGEDITETLEVIPRQWKVIQYIREKFTCRPKGCRGREHLTAASTFPCDPVRLCRPEPACHDLVREIWAASATQSAKRVLR